jgi:hypothetical protein
LELLVETKDHDERQTRLVAEFVRAATERASRR